MAAPAEANIKNLNGVWTMNKTESDPTDPILSLQGVGWIIRKAIGMMTVTLIIRQEVEADGVTVVTIQQPGTAGIKGTEEKRNIPVAGGDKLWRDHEDHVFGHVKGYTQWIKNEDLSDSDEDEAFLKAGWVDGPDHVDSYVESQGNGWVARQIWGFAEVESAGQTVRKYVRRVVVRKGKDFKRARLVYDYKEELKN